MSSLFNSDETDEPFTHCCDCGCDLASADMYVVNKSYARTECVFEFAMCFTCREEMNAKLSEKSRVAMFDFMHDNANMETRQKALGNDSEVEAYLESCLTCGKNRHHAAGYTSGAIFANNALVKGPFPIIICDTCERTLAETVSEETRNVWDKFVADNFPAPPAEVKSPPRRKPVII